MKVGSDGSGGVALFADDEEEADFNARFAKLVGGRVKWAPSRLTANRRRQESVGISW